MLSSLRPSTKPAAVADPPVKWTSTMVTSQTEYSPGGGAKVQNQRGRGSAFVRRDSSSYTVLMHLAALSRPHLKVPPS